MNYQLAMMALEGLAKGALEVRVETGGIVIEGSSASFKDLARLFLLLGSEGVDKGEEMELQPGTHVTSNSPAITLRLT